MKEREGYGELEAASFVMEQARSDAMSGAQASYPLNLSSIYISYDDEGKILYYLVMPDGLVEEFGHPSEITVTVEPGDTLNP